MSARAKGALAVVGLLTLAALGYVLATATESPVTVAIPEPPDAGAEIDSATEPPSPDEVAPEPHDSEAEASDREAATALMNEIALTLISPATPPEAAQILAERPSGRDLYVLAAIDRTGDGEPAADEARSESTDEGGNALEPCEELEGQDDAWCDCVVRSAANPDIGYRTALGGTVVRIELFRTRQYRDGRTVLAHRVLTGPVHYENIADNPPELRVNDVDHDGRPEVTAIFSFAVPDCDTFQEDWGTLAVILDGGDLHLQAIFAREHVSSGGDSDVNSVSDETTWRFAPSESDPSLPPATIEPLETVQLEVRRTERSSFMEAEDDGPTEARTSSRWVCPYDAAADRWSCPNDATVLTTWVSTVSPLLASPSP